jgi:ABC-type sugar transport system substrate-binding protein
VKHRKLIPVLTGLALATAATLAPVGSALAAAKGAKVILLTVSEECEYCSLYLKSFKKAAAAAGLDLQVQINKFDAAEQASQIDQAIAQKPSVLVVWPADASAIVPSLRKIKKAGIPLVVSNSIPDMKYQDYWNVFTGPNDDLNAANAAKAMKQGFEAKGLGGSGDVFIINGVLGTPPQIRRYEGFKKTLAAEAPGIKIVGAQPGDWDQTKATNAASALFTQFGSNVKGVYAQADNMASGVVVAAQRAGITPSKLVIVGSNCSPEGIKAIEDGTQYASVLQSPADDGEYAVKAVVDILDGKPVEKTRYIPSTVITKDNVKACYAGAGR